MIIQSKYFNSTPKGYLIAEFTMIFVLTVVGGYALLIFGPMMTGKGRRLQEEDVRLKWFQTVIENQELLLFCLVAFAFFIGIYAVLRKKKLHVVRLELNENELVLGCRRIYKKEITIFKIPLSELTIKRNTYRLNVFLGHENAFEFFHNGLLAGIFFFDHYFWSDQRRSVQLIIKKLSAHAIDGKFKKIDPPDFFKT
jgi:hypothetical protein